MSLVLVVEASLVLVVEVSLVLTVEVSPVLMVEVSPVLRVEVSPVLTVEESRFVQALWVSPSVQALGESPSVQALGVSSSVLALGVSSSVLALGMSHSVLTVEVSPSVLVMYMQLRHHKNLHHNICSHNINNIGHHHHNYKIVKPLSVEFISIYIFNNNKQKTCYTYYALDCSYIYSIPPLSGGLRSFPSRKSRKPANY